MNREEKRDTIVFGLDDASGVAKRLVMLLKTCQVVAFTGSLGAGKTTLVREILRHVGIQEPVTSPTFNYVNVYVNKEGRKFYHFDLYRITTLDDFCMAGFDEYLYQPDSWSFIEWPEPILSLLTHNVCFLDLEYKGSGRMVTIR